MEFKIDLDKIKLAKAEVGNIHKGESIFLDTEVDDPNVHRIELPIPSLNYILSRHYYGEGSGFAMGRVYNIFGPESIGKTSIAQLIAGTVIKDGGHVHWIDKEASLDPEYLDVFGIDINDTDHFSVSKPDNAEQALDTIVSFVKNEAANLIVLDSIPALGSIEMNEKNTGDKSMMVLAGLLSNHFPKIMTKIEKSNISVIYINQLRANMVGGIGYGDKSTGGNAMKFYPHIALRLKKPQNNVLEKGTGMFAEYIGQQSFIQAVKNKTAPPKKHTVLNHYPEEGFSRVSDIMNLAFQVGTATKAGSWISLGEDRFQGIEKTRQALLNNDELLESLWDRTKILLEPKVDESTGEILE